MPRFDIAIAIGAVRDPLIDSASARGAYDSAAASQNRRAPAIFALRRGRPAPVPSRPKTAVLDSVPAQGSNAGDG